jgi:hypothetical protein
MLMLPQQWGDYLRSQPETGMGYQIVTITTKDGRNYPQAVIHSGCVTRVRGHDTIPFGVDDISSIQVTHEKWNWLAERPAR